MQTSGQVNSKPASTQGDSGGSSPLIPILIAIAVLALISFGAMMIKQRRQRGASSSRVSPKAS